jgi:hypothetical protein
MLLVVVGWEEEKKGDVSFFCSGVKCDIAAIDFADCVGWKVEEKRVAYHKVVWCCGSAVDGTGRARWNDVEMRVV